MTTKHKDKKVTNGIIHLPDGRTVMQCGNKLVEIKFVPLKAERKRTQ